MNIKGMFAHKGYATKFFISLLLLIFCTCLFQSIGIIAQKLCNDDMAGLKLLQFFSALGMFVIAPLVMSYFINPTPLDYLSIRKANTKYYLIGTICLFASIPFINYITFLNEQMNLPFEDIFRNLEDKNTELANSFLEVHSIGGFFANLIVLALIPAIGEELLFRGFLLKALSNISKNIHVAIWTSGILFSAIHLQFYGFFPRMIMGVLFGYMLFWSKSLLVPMVCHFINNATIVCSRYFIDTEETFAEEFGKQDITLALVSMFLLAAGCYYMAHINHDSIDS